MKVRLVRRPKFTALDVIHYDDLQAALESSADLLTTAPYAVEVTDKMILDLARENIEQRARMGFVQGDPAAIMIVEYSGESEAEVRAKIEALEALRKRIGYAAHLAYDPAEQQSIWKLRKAGLGLLLGTKGDRKPIAFVEDTAVEPAKLGPFINRFRRSSPATARGRVLRPLLGGVPPHPPADQPEGRGRDPEDARDRRGDHRRARRGVRRRAFRRARRRAGASPFNETLYGPRLYDAFRQVKRAFDPKGILNPGNIVDAPPMTEHLRYGPEYRAWEPDPSGLLGAGRLRRPSRCATASGSAGKSSRGRCAPRTWRRSTRSTRPGAGQRAPRRAVGQGAAAGVHGTPALRGARSLPGCKACKAECPANVDMAKLKYEFLAHYYRAHGLPLRNRLFGRIHALARVGSALAPCRTGSRARRPTRWLLERLAGIDRRRPLPSFAGESFVRWFGSRGPEGTGARGEVVLFHDTFNTYQTPNVAIAATQLWRRSATALSSPTGVLRTAHDLERDAGRGADPGGGQRGPARPGRTRGPPIVGLEPSCLLTLRDEYPELVRTEDARWRARACSSRSS